MSKKLAWNLFIGDRIVHRGETYKVTRNKNNSRINPKPMPSGLQDVTLETLSPTNKITILVFDCRDELEVKR